MCKPIRSLVWVILKYISEKIRGVKKQDHDDLAKSVYLVRVDWKQTSKWRHLLAKCNWLEFTAVVCLIFILRGVSCTKTIFVTRMLMKNKQIYLSSRFICWTKKKLYSSIGMNRKLVLWDDQTFSLSWIIQLDTWDANLFKFLYKGKWKLL